MPDPAHPPQMEHLDDLSPRLDALGRGLVSRESPEPPASLLRVVRARRSRPMALRIGLLAAAMIAIGFAVFLLSSRQPPTMTPPQVVDNTQRGTTAPQPPPTLPLPQPLAKSSPTLATLRRLNPDPAPEALYLPTIATTTTPAIPATPADSRDPGALARIVGPGR